MAHFNRRVECATGLVCWETISVGVEAVWTQCRGFGLGPMRTADGWRRRRGGLGIVVVVVCRRRNPLVPAAFHLYRRSNWWPEKRSRSTIEEEKTM